MSKHTKKVNRVLRFIILMLCFAILITFIWIKRQPQSDTNDPVYLPVTIALTPSSQLASTTTANDSPSILPEAPRPLSQYIKVTDSCDAHFTDECLVVRSGPGKKFPVVSKLRNGVVLKISDTTEEEDGLWHKVIFDEWLRYPERLAGDWYVSSEYVEVVEDTGDLTIWDNEYSTSTSKKIVVDRSEQSLTAYDGEDLFVTLDISTGLELTPTPRGTFQVFKKTPSRYMQGPLPGLADQQYYDLPGVPWNLYFTEGGAVIHGAYWHKSFGKPYSHGCVNVEPNEAKLLYDWAELGTTVVVKD